MSHFDTVKVGQKGFSEADKNIQAENENLRKNVDPPTPSLFPFCALKWLFPKSQAKQKSAPGESVQPGVGAGAPPDSASHRACSQLHCVSFPWINREYLCHED